MTETPKCPYCGAETRLNENNEGIYWYECRECNATGPTEKTSVEAFSAALHRAEPEMRPLTLEELKEHCKNQDAQPLWVEYKESPEISRWILANAPDDVMDSPLTSRWIEIENIAVAYLRKWRCWLRKPTAEEMEREKWEE